MKQIIVAAIIALSAGAALAQAKKTAPAAPGAPIATTGVYKKAPPAPKHKKATVKKERSKKSASF